MGKSSTIGTIALIGIVGVGAYYLISSVKGALDNFKLPSLPNFPNVPSIINNWFESFKSETIIQKEARLTTTPAAIINQLDTQERGQNISLGGFKGGPNYLLHNPLSEVPPLPAVQNIVFQMENQQRIYTPQLDVHQSLIGAMMNSPSYVLKVANVDAGAASAKTAVLNKIAVNPKATFTPQQANLALMMPTTQEIKVTGNWSNKPSSGTFVKAINPATTKNITFTSKVAVSPVQQTQSQKIQAAIDKAVKNAAAGNKAVLGR